MLKNRKTVGIAVFLVVFFSASATFGYSLLTHKNIKETAKGSKAAAAVPAIPTTNYVIPAGAIYMSPTGSDANAGTASAPVKTINKAQSIAPSGGTVVLRGGVYRDGMGAFAKALTWQAYPNEQVWLDGTDLVTGWAAGANNTWYIDGWYTPEFCAGQYYSYAYNAQKSDNSGPCNHIDMSSDPSNPMAGSPQMAFVNGTPLKEVTSLAGVTSGTFFYDKSSRRFTIGTNPSGATVELARRANAMIPTAATSIKGLGFRHYATNEYNNNTEAPVVISGANSRIENSVFWQNAAYGLGASNPAGLTVRTSQFLSNGFNGMTANGHHAGSATVDNIVLDSNIFDSNNSEKFGTGCGLSCAQAAVKFSHMNGGKVINNKFLNTNGQGFWCDLYCTNFTITGNYTSGNTGTSLMYEVSDKAIIASNVVIGGEYGVRVAGPNVKLYNNTIIGGKRMALWVYDDPRTPSGSEIPADTATVEVGNNIMQGGTDFLQWLEGQQTTWSQLESYSDYNSFFRPTGTPATGFKYGTKGVDSYSATVALYRSATGKETNSQDVVNNTNPYFTNSASGDYRIRTDSVAYKTGKPLAADVAAAVGVSAGTSVDRGALLWVGMPGSVVTPPAPAPDTTKPVTAIISPVTNASAKGTIAISGSATDNVGVVKVELLVDGAVKQTDTILPYATFSFDSTTVSDGTHIFAFKAYDAAGNTATSAAVSVVITNATPPPLPVINSFIANPSSLTAGASSTLSWSTQYASSCDVNPGGTQGTTATSWLTPALTTVGTKTYTLVCYNTAVQSVSKTVTVTVNAAPTAPSRPAFAADKTTIQSGGSVTFNWSSVGATSCVFNPGNIGGAATVNGKIVTNITATTTYSLACQNAVGTTQATPITVTVSAAPVPVALPLITAFTADNTNIGYNQSTTLRWNTTGVIASGCRMNPGTDQGPSGSITTGNLTESMSYTLTCKNSEGKSVSASTSVKVAGKPAPIAPTPIVSTIDPTQAAADTVTNQQTGSQVANVSVDDQVSGLASLDISNVVDATKEKSIKYVEYYDGEKLVQKVSEAPFALNTKLLANGSYSITERTYYIDGSQSEVTKVLGVQNIAGASAQHKTGNKLIGISVVIVLTLSVIAVILWFTKSLWMSLLEQKAPLLAEKLHTYRSVNRLSAIPKNADTTIVISPDKKE